MNATTKVLEDMADNIGSARDIAAFMNQASQAYSSPEVAYIQPTEAVVCSL